VTASTVDASRKAIHMIVIKFFTTSLSSELFIYVVPNLVSTVIPESFRNPVGKVPPAHTQESHHCRYLFRYLADNYLSA